jgi:uncharacterized protein (TIGR02246 family)
MKISAPTIQANANIASVLQSYETALNASDVDNVMTVYMSDGVFMPENAPSAVGTDKVKDAYTYVFGAMTFDVELQVEEIVQLAPNWAFVRTNSVGFVTLHAAGIRVPAANHELFIFQKGSDSEWKIARYCFSTTNPPQ